VHPNFILAWLSERYGAAFSSAECQLLRSYTNDVYLIHSSGQTFVLKLYGLGWRTLTDLQWEIDLLRHVSAQGVPVAGPIAARDRLPIQSIATEAGQRLAVLFPYVAGEKPQPPFSIALYEQFGQAIGRLHAATNSFATAYPRQALDTNVLIDQPIGLVAPLLSNSNERTWLLELANLVKDRIATYAAAGLDWGPIHGDASLDNLHVTEDGSVILYDFDSAGFGWRAADLQGWAVSHSDYSARWDAFHRGYNRAHSLAEIDRLAAPYLTIAWDMWGMKIDLERRILSLGQKQVEEFLATQLKVLRSRSRQYGIAMRAFA
jgi:Ser/Thr protein kinase RdoA (MazF antagonist)